MLNINGSKINNSVPSKDDLFEENLFLPTEDVWRKYFKENNHGYLQGATIDYKSFIKNSVKIRLLGEVPQELIKFYTDTSLGKSYIDPADIENCRYYACGDSGTFPATSQLLYAGIKGVYFKSVCVSNKRRNFYITGRDAFVKRKNGDVLIPDYVVVYWTVKGRPLIGTELHHLDGNRHNCSPVNIIAISKQLHRKISADNLRKN